MTMLIIHSLPLLPVCPHLRHTWDTLLPCSPDRCQTCWFPLFNIFSTKATEFGNRSRRLPVVLLSRTRDLLISAAVLIYLVRQMVWLSMKDINFKNTPRTLIPRFVSSFPIVKIINPSIRLVISFHEDPSYLSCLPSQTCFWKLFAPFYWPPSIPRLLTHLGWTP